MFILRSTIGELEQLVDAVDVIAGNTPILVVVCLETVIPWVLILVVGFHYTVE